MLATVELSVLLWQHVPSFGCRCQVKQTVQLITDKIKMKGTQVLWLACLKAVEVENFIHQFIQKLSLKIQKTKGKWSLLIYKKYHYFHIIFDIFCNKNGDIY